LKNAHNQTGPFSHKGERGYSKDNGSCIEGKRRDSYRGSCFHKEERGSKGGKEKKRCTTQYAGKLATQSTLLGGQGACQERENEMGRNFNLRKAHHGGGGRIFPGEIGKAL